MRMSKNEETMNELKQMRKKFEQIIKEEIFSK